MSAGDQAPLVTALLTLPESKAMQNRAAGLPVTIIRKYDSQFHFLSFILECDPTYKSLPKKGCIYDLKML